jgi:hypothetical protein
MFLIVTIIWLLLYFSKSLIHSYVIVQLCVSARYLYVMIIINKSYKKRVSIIFYLLILTLPPSSLFSTATSKPAQLH